MEFNVDRHVKTYWDKLKFIGLSNAKADEFKDATCENSVRISKFLEGLNLDPIMPELNKHYSVSEGEEMYPRRAMFKTMVFRKIKKIKYYTRTQRYLDNYPDEAIELGFNMDLIGNVITEGLMMTTNILKICSGKQQYQLKRICERRGLMEVTMRIKTLHWHTLNSI